MVVVPYALILLLLFFVLFSALRRNQFPLRHVVRLKLYSSSFLVLILSLAAVVVFLMWRGIHSAWMDFSLQQLVDPLKINNLQIF
ncbi:MAG: hypothetical protein MK005_03405 [Alcanivorax sp.]|nr:hypothetical protein [Alcanivorax sp.]